MSNPSRISTWLLGLLGITMAFGQPSRAQTSGPAERSVPQIRLDRFDFSFVPPHDLRFAVVTDTHFERRTDMTALAEAFRPDLDRTSWRGRQALHSVRAQKALDQIELNDVAFVLHLGDVVSFFPNWNRYAGYWQKCAANARRSLDRLKRPCYVVPGNHDIGNKLTLKRLGKQTPAYADPRNVETYREAFDRPPWLHAEHNGTLLVVVCDALINSGQDLETQQWQWLEALLAARAPKVRNIVLATHNVPYWNSPRDIGVLNYEVIDEPGRSRLLGLCDRYKIRAWLSGHTHWEILNRHHHTLLTTAWSTSFTRNGSWNLYRGVPSNQDTAKAGYYYWRAAGDKLVGNFVRTVDLLPAARSFQAAGPFEPRRIIPLHVRDGRPARLALTINANWQRLADGRPELAIDGIRQRRPGHGGKDEQYLAWHSSPTSTLEHEWLEVALPARCTLDHAVLYPAAGGIKGAYTISVSPDGQQWSVAAQGGPTDLDEPVRCKLGGRAAVAVRYTVARGAGPAMLREFELLDSDGCNVAAASMWATARASSWLAQRDSAKSTLSLSAALDLNAAIVRLQPDGTSWRTVCPRPGVMGLDRLVVETADYAAADGATVCVVLGGADEKVGIDEFREYTGFLAERLGSALLWEIHGSDAQFAAARQEIGRRIPAAQFAAPRALPDADVIVQNYTGDLPQTDRPMLLLMPPFEPQRARGPAVALLRDCLRILDDPLLTPCFDLRSARGLLDDLDNPMYACYALRTMATALAGAKPSAAHCRAIDGVNLRHFTTPTGRLIVLDPVTATRADLELTRPAREAVLVDPLTATSQSLRMDGQAARGLALPDYPVVIRLR